MKEIFSQVSVQKILLTIHSISERHRSAKLDQNCLALSNQRGMWAKFREFSQDVRFSLMVSKTLEA